MPPRRSPLPRISVVVPSFNQGHFLREALDSIFRQEYPDLEVVVMDGGSTDRSVEIIRSYAPQLKYWQSRPDGGQAAAINSGMKHCSGEIVAWLNSDDYYWGDALWSVGEAYVQHPGYGLYVGNGLRLDQATGAFSPFCNRHVAFDRGALVYGTDFILQPSAFHLREAWEKVNGLDPKLSFCLDWDLYIRIARDYPVVCLQEHLSVTREYHETKTRSGKMRRAAEIVSMVQAHTNTEVTPGSLLFLFETLLAVTVEGMPPALADHLRGAQGTLSRELALRYGGGHGFPECSDPQDAMVLPFAESEGGRPYEDAGSLPTISVIVLQLPDCKYLHETCASIENQAYPNAQQVVVDAGSNPAEAIKKGLADSQGEIVGWINPGDLLATGAFHEVGRAFAEDPELDVVFGNAVSIDRDGEMSLSDHGPCFSGLWLGTFEGPADTIPYGSEVFAIPQSTVFFRRRVLERCGGFNSSFRHIYDYELLRRVLVQAKTKKIERIQAFVRVEQEVHCRRWNDILAELYRLSRPQWAGLFTRRFPATLCEFLLGYMRRKFPGGSRKLRFWGMASLAAIAAALRLGNPERWWVRRSSLTLDEAAPFRLPPPRFGSKRGPIGFPSSHSGRKSLYRRSSRDGSCHSVVSATTLGAAEHELLGRLRAIGTVEVFCWDGEHPQDQADAVHMPATIAAIRPDLVNPRAARPALRSHLANWLRRRHVPVVGPHFPLWISEQLPHIHGYFRSALKMTLERNRPDFLFVSSQSNPVALTLSTDELETRLILLVHELEADRSQAAADSARGMAHLALSGETVRACRFERRNLARYDGVIAANEHVRQRLAETYDFPAERIAVMNDVRLGEWLAWLRERPRRYGAGIALPIDSVVSESNFATIPAGA